MLERTISVCLDIKNQKVSKDLAEIISSLEGFHIHKFDEKLSYDLLIFEIGDDFQREFQILHSIQTSGAVKEIFLTSSRTEPDLLIQALRAGAKEFFAQPLKREEVKNALLKFKERNKSVRPVEEGAKKGKTIYLIGSKGGVGTTTVAVNLAASLKEFSEPSSVALIDMNLLFGEIPIFLNIQSGFNWGEIVRNISRVDPTYLMSILSRHKSGIYVLPSPTGLDGTNVVTPEIIEKLLVLMRDVFDFIVIDGGQSLDATSLKIMEISDYVLLIAILSLPCLTNVKRLIWTFQNLGYPQQEKIRVIINRYHKKSLISLKEAEQTINQSIFWLVPNDYANTMSAINQGKHLAAIARGAEITKSLKDLSLNLSGKGEKKKAKAGFWNREGL